MKNKVYDIETNRQRPFHILRTGGGIGEKNATASGRRTAKASQFSLLIDICVVESQEARRLSVSMTGWACWIIMRFLLIFAMTLWSLQKARQQNQRARPKLGQLGRYLGSAERKDISRKFENVVM